MTVATSISRKLPLEQTSVQSTPTLRKRSVLVVEDDPDIAQLLQLHLREHCTELVWSSTGADGLRQALQGSWDLVILDLRLPDVGGLEICRQLRERQIYTPIVMLTAKSSELDRVLGLELGADDYVVKPFSVPELMSRIKAIFRRCEAMQLQHRQQSQSALSTTVDNLTITPQQRRVVIDDNPIELTAREFDLLLHFISHPGRVFSRSQLLDAVWGAGHEGYEHTVNSHINRLRAKIEPDPAKPSFILTVWGVGYRFRNQC